MRLDEPAHCMPPQPLRNRHRRHRIPIDLSICVEILVPLVSQNADRATCVDVAHVAPFRVWRALHTCTIHAAFCGTRNSGTRRQAQEIAAN